MSETSVFLTGKQLADADIAAAAKHPLAPEETEAVVVRLQQLGPKDRLDTLSYIMELATEIMALRRLRKSLVTTLTEVKSGLERKCPDKALYRLVIEALEKASHV